MMSGQFVKGKIDGVQKTFESPVLDKILPSSKLQELADITEIGEYPQFFKQKVAFIKTVITPAQNTDGRRGGIVNYTVVHSFPRNLNQETIPYIIDFDTLTAEILSGKRRWKMPQMPVLPKTDSTFALIDPPPPIEWEAQ